MELPANSPPASPGELEHLGKEQALMVAEDNKFDLDEVKRFSLNEGHEKEFLEFKRLCKINYKRR